MNYKGRIIRLSVDIYYWICCKFVICPAYCDNPCISDFDIMRKFRLNWFTVNACLRYLRDIGYIEFEHHFPFKMVDITLVGLATDTYLEAYHDLTPRSQCKRLFNLI